MKDNNIIIIGDLPDGAMDHFLKVCNALYKAYEQVALETKCLDIQIFLNALQYSYVTYLSSYLVVSGKDEDKNIEEYLTVMRKNICWRIENMRKEKTPGI